MSKKVKAGMLLSVLWMFGWFVFLVNVGVFTGKLHTNGSDWAIWMLVTFSPLILGWGIWWVRKD